MPYEKNKPLTQEENELWEKLVAQCKKVNEALDKGYVLVDAEHDVLSDRFVFECGNDKDECIALYKKGFGWSIYCYKTAMTTHGYNTYLEEYKATENSLSLLSLIPKNDLIEFFDL